MDWRKVKAMVQSDMTLQRNLQEKNVSRLPQGGGRSLWWVTATNSSPPENQSSDPMAVRVGDVAHWRQAGLGIKWSATSPSVGGLGERTVAIDMVSGSTHH
ncbi:unnamed protein product [Cylindrotheca closterium]|uniref:Uncharacterized protein n=1 Tax=Cylindrotheca closterium TaxID=2856 RepID=A0AAD2GBH2_9STRA|nr:unnamed protein product [Cylindrotheca closterium]